MNLINILKLAFSNLLLKKTRTFVTVGGISVCVAITLFMIGASIGIQKTIEEALEKPEFSNVITANTKTNKTIIDEAMLSTLGSINNVSRVEYIANLSGTLVYHGTTKASPVYALSDNYFSVAPVIFESGNNFGEVKTGLDQVIINTRMMESIGIENTTEAIGKKISLNILVTNDLAPTQTEPSKDYSGNEYQIIGIIDKGETPLVYVPVGSVSKLGVKNFNQAKILVTSFDKVQLAKESVDQLGLVTTSAKDIMKQFDRVFSLIRFVLVIFGIVTLIIATLGTLNTITISLVEETRQIGFLRLIGIREKDVKYLFISESILLSFTGTIIGVFLSYILIVLGNKWISMFTEGTITGLLQFSYFVVIIVLFISLILGLLTGINPAKRAVKIDPLVALRF